MSILTGNFNKIRNIETEKSKSKVYLFTGHLGSGKTTLINNILKNIDKEERKNLVLIINDVWTQNIDFSRLEAENKDLEMSNISGNWCICCGDLASFEKEIEKIRNNEKENWIVKNLIIEPSWIADPKKMDATLKKFWFEAVVVNNLNPLILKEKNEDEIKKFINENIAISDFICLMETWSFFDEEAKKILESLTSWKNIRIIPKWSLWIENMNQDENQKNPFANFLKDLQNKTPTKKNIFSILDWEKKQEIAISRENQKISRYKLVNLVKAFSPYLVRAKWVLADWKDFDISFWENIDIKRIPSVDINTKTYKIPKKRNFAFNFIFSPDTPKEILEDFENFLENPEKENKENYEKYFWSNGIPSITKQADYQGKIDKLVEQFFEYMDLDSEKNEILKEIENLEKIENPEEKLEKNLILEKNLNEKKSQLSQLWDDMKFDSPIIWLKYKIQAYKWTSWEISTIWDLTNHCFKSNDYICGKRIDFLAKYLKNKFKINIFEMDENMNLEEFFNKYENELNNICQDEKIMNLWLRYEYFTIWKKVAKWENYRRSKTFYEKNL